MKPILTAIKNPVALSALRNGALIMSIFALLDFIIQYVIARQFYTDAIGNELDHSNGDFSNQAGTFIAALSISGFLTLCLLIGVLVFMYRTVFATLRKTGFKPRLRANTTAALFFLASILAIVVSNSLSLLLPYSSMGGTVNGKSSIVISVIGFIISTIFAAVAAILVRHFAYTRALKEKEELFS